MKVFKFGGASVKNAAGVKNVASIIERYNSDDLVVVVSAMGKTTNLLESLVKAHFNGWDETFQIYLEFRNFHQNITNILFGGEEMVPPSIVALLDDLEMKLNQPPSLFFDFEYDQLICYGELVSSLILSEYLTVEGQINKWVDIRRSLRTDDKYREASVNWKWTEMLVQNTFQFAENRLYITQGFIGSTVTNLT